MALARWFAAASTALLLVFVNSTARSEPAGLAPNLPDSPFARTLDPMDSSTAAPAGYSDSQTSPVPQTTKDAAPSLTSQEQLKLQEKQRVFGVMAAFNTTANKDALPLTTGQKYQLFFKSATDPWPFVLTAFGAGIDQADNSFPEYGQGMQGYAKRYGAAYTDYFTGNLLGNAVLAGVLKEDPRYFQKGTGSFTSRFFLGGDQHGLVQAR